MKKLLTLLTVSVLALTGCSLDDDDDSSSPISYEEDSSELSSEKESEPEYYDTSDIQVLSPKGGPAVAFYNKAVQLTSTGEPTTIPGQFLADNYDAVVFDFYNGLKANKAKGGHFKLAKILTANNLYLVGINKTTEPQAGDKIVAFGENLLPDLAFKEIYKDVLTNVDYVDAVGKTSPILINKTYLGDSVDYVLTSEPVLYRALEQVEDKSIYTTFNVASKWEELKGKGHIIPQAGLFFNMHSYTGNEGKYNQFLEELNKDITRGIILPNRIKTGFEAVGDETAQNAKFGLTATEAYNITDKNNGCGLVDDTFQNSAISTFLTDLGNTEDYSAYIL